MRNIFDPSPFALARNTNNKPIQKTVIAGLHSIWPYGKYAKANENKTLQWTIINDPDYVRYWQSQDLPDKHRLCRDRYPEFYRALMSFVSYVPQQQQPLSHSSSLPPPPFAGHQGTQQRNSLTHVQSQANLLAEQDRYALAVDRLQQQQQGPKTYTNTVSARDQPSKTPKHNAPQNMFLYKPFQRAATVNVFAEMTKKVDDKTGELTPGMDPESLKSYRIWLWETIEIDSVEFECRNGSDVRVSGTFIHEDDVDLDPGSSASNSAGIRKGFDFYFQIKPSVGEEYPGYLRQIKGEQAIIVGTRSSSSSSSRFGHQQQQQPQYHDRVERFILYTKSFQLTSTSLEELYLYFTSSGFTIILEQDAVDFRDEMTRPKVNANENIHTFQSPPNLKSDSYQQQDASEDNDAIPGSFAFGNQDYHTENHNYGMASEDKPPCLPEPKPLCLPEPIHHMTESERRYQSFLRRHPGKIEPYHLQKPQGGDKPDINNDLFYRLNIEVSRENERKVSQDSHGFSVTNKSQFMNPKPKAQPDTFLELISGKRREQVNTSAKHVTDIKPNALSLMVSGIKETNSNNETAVKQDSTKPNFYESTDIRKPFVKRVKRF